MSADDSPLSMDKNRPESSSSHYRLYRGWPAQIIATAIVFAGVAVGLIAASASGGGPPWFFSVIWVGAYCWVMPQMLTRVTHDLTLQGDVLRWKTPLRSGSFSVNDIRSIRPYRLGPNAEVIELKSGQRLFVPIMKGFAEFAAEVASRAPFAQVELGGFVELAERWPGPRRHKK